MPTALVGASYLLFFLSGATALVYQVLWVRSLTLVFGGSHLAVTAVLSIFMGGLALGGYLSGRHADRIVRPLRVYGVLELGIAASALAFAGLMKIYPAIYAALAQGRDDAPIYLTAVRMLFAGGALLVPTILMGATLPVLSRFASGESGTLRSQLSFLYGFNTLGAVLGAILAGFVFLPAFAVSTTLLGAVATNAAIGLLAIALQAQAPDMVSRDAGPAVDDDVMAPATPDDDIVSPTLLLFGAALSGFCALGYEVLWTRVLTLAVGASVYGFTLILAAFLTGIALGSKAYGLFAKIFRNGVRRTATVVALFGVTQVIVGVTALLATVYLRDIPANAVRLQTWFLGPDATSFRARVWTGFTLSFLYMVVPAFFMGAAFPLAGDVLVRLRRSVGRGVGEVLASNTTGALLGAAVSGLVMIRLFGIERSLLILTAMNVGLGLVVLAGLAKRRWAPAAVGTATLAAIAYLAANPGALPLWDRTYFAVFRSNQPEAFATPEMIREAVENTDVLFYAEGTESIVSVIRVKGGEQAFITNGRIEASSHLQAQQLQLTLGHLPMLLQRDPREVLVVGMGSGMTAGAALVHPNVERVTLAEIEPQVRGVAKTFEDYNHHVLENTKLDLVVNDGRNFLLTTKRTFDVITADPIHPWFRGAGYLYSREYFELAARHLRPGGVIAQWLPLYELTPRDVASVVKTFQQHFGHTMMWLTHYDAVIVGGNAPFAIDEAELERRITAPPVLADLQKVAMGSAANLLGYFLMGTDGMKAFGQPGVVNTDDRLYLEFSAPFSIATPGVMASNIDALAGNRESVLPYLKAEADAAARAQQQARAAVQLKAGRLGDRALALFLGRSANDPAFTRELRRLNTEYPSYAPGLFLAAEYHAALALEPRLLQRTSLAVTGDNGATTVVELCAVLVPVSKSRAAIMFVDNNARVVYGQSYVDDYGRDGLADRIASDVIAAVRTAYDSEALAAHGGRQGPPRATATLERLRAVIKAKVQRGQSES